MQKKKQAVCPKFETFIGFCIFFAWNVEYKLNIRV